VQKFGVLAFVVSITLLCPILEVPGVIYWPSTGCTKVFWGFFSFHQVGFILPRGINLSFFIIIV